MSYMPVTDAIFLMMESREHPMHVGGLQLFTPPDGAGADYVSTMVTDIRERCADVDPRFLRRPAAPVNSMGNMWWSVEDTLDAEYHIRHSALPQPGRIRELFQMTSRWHGSLLDRHHPMWEMHLIEGLEDGRFALYTKMHHSLLDGVSALRLLQNTFTDDPDGEFRSPWDTRDRTNIGHNPSESSGVVGQVLALGGSAMSLGGTLAGFVPASVKVLNEAIRDHHYITPFSAPRSILNQRIGGARRFVAQSYALSRIQAVAQATDATLNDVVLTMCGGALRRYLIELGELPDRSLTAMVPVSLRASDDDGSEGGNAVGAMICSLATTTADPMEALSTVCQSARSAKQLMRQLSPLQTLMLSAANVAPMGLGGIPGFVSATRPPFNVIISNVPGPSKQLYWNGSRLDGIYPASIVLDGQAINITLTSNADHLDFGIIGCRQTLPSLQRMITHIEDTLAQLEAALT